MIHSALVWTGIAVTVVLIVDVNHLAATLRRLERVGQALVSGAVPSDKVWQLARDPGGRFEAMTAYRQETGANVSVAVAVVRTLRSSGH